ncbi:16S rRNA (cytidine(1402)-2'-O)-methyltransferase [Candidatus Auribacterota bacterium]
MSTSGTLYIVGTPIGNLEDISFRALETLKKAQLILAEDTRKTKHLLNHFEIKNRLESYHKHNEKKKNSAILKKLEKGEEIAIVSNAGMPLISDPGYLLIKQVIEKKIPLIPIPGPTALTTALAVSGLDSSAFSFFGFLPKKINARTNILIELLNKKETLIFYESPNRILDTLNIISTIDFTRKIVIGRELTKIFEEIIYGEVKQIVDDINSNKIKLKGEFVLLIEGYSETRESKSYTSEELKNYLTETITSDKISSKEAISKVSKKLNIPKKIVYKASLDI